MARVLTSELVLGHYIYYRNMTDFFWIVSTVTGIQILFQYAARHGALTVHDLLAAIEASDEEGDTSMG